MRKVANVRNAESGFSRCIMCATDEGVFVFRCLSREDGSAEGDYWFSSVEEAESSCQETFGILPADWVIVDDPLPGCQHDWLTPVRVKERDKGSPEWGKVERLEGNEWVEFDPKRCIPKDPQDR